jgi:hypothetical protein
MKQQHEMLTMRNILGWTTESQDKTLHNSPDLQSPPITNSLSSTKWKNKVAKKQQEVLEQ